MKQHGCEAALLCSVQACSALARLQLQPGKCSCLSLGERESGLLVRGELTYIERSPCPLSLIVHTHANEGSKSSQFDWSKKHCADWSKWSFSGWLVKGFSCVAPIGWGKPQSYWLKYNFRNSFIRAGSDGRNTVQAGSAEVWLVWEAPVWKWLLGSVF